MSQPFFNRRLLLRLRRSRRSSTRLVPLWGLPALLCILFLTGCEKKVAKTYGLTNAELRSSETCEPNPPQPDLFADLIQSDARHQTQQTLADQLRALTEVVREHVRGEDAQSDAGRLISPTFSATGVDWNSFGPRFRDSAIRVERWQKSDKSPRFEGDRAFAKFLTNAFAPWAGSNDFRIELKPYSTTSSSELPNPGTMTAAISEAAGVVTAKLVAEVYSETSGKSGGGTGQQATALWTTRWKKADQEDTLLLESIGIIAQESVELSAESGQLFHDCTASILASTDLLETQLAWGLDQWARRIPGIDIVGEQGIAVSDIDGDGLDDLYVCQAQGLPNLLLIQNPDGSVRDAGANAGVDILDHSRAALMVDLDNDGDQDLAITTEQSLLLMSQKDDGKFQLEHELSIGHSGHSLSAADYDQDGDLDLYICKHRSVKNFADLMTIPESRHAATTGGRNVLLRNDEGWKFEDVTDQTGFTVDENRYYSRSAVWSDYDHDGDPDLYIANEWAPDQLYRNDRGWFTEVAQDLGMTSAAQHRSVSCGEFNLDGRPDFFVATDSPLAAREAASFFRNSGGAISAATEGAGADAANPKRKKSANEKSILGEGQIWFSRDQAGSEDASAKSERGEGKRDFASFFLRAPIFSAESAFSSVAADINNDGLDDVIVTNGHLTRQSSEDIGTQFYADALGVSKSRKSSEGVVVHRAEENDLLSLVRSGFSMFGNQRNRCYLSIGRLGFANFSGASGLDFDEDARAVATTDWDNDGDVDVVMTSRTGPQLRIFSNVNDSVNRFLHFDLVGTTSNRDAVGARVDLYLSDREFPLTKSVSAGSGNLSQSSKRLFFGLGKDSLPEKAIVTWPNGDQQTFTSLVANTRYQIVEGDNQLAERTNERFELVLRRSRLAGNLTLPEVPVAHFNPESWLVNLEYQGKTGQWFKAQTARNAATAIVFCDQSNASRTFLERFVAQVVEADKQQAATNGREPGAIDFDVVVIDASSSNMDEADRQTRATEFFEALDLPFRWGAAADSTIAKLKLYHGEWFANERHPELPLALVVNAYGQLASCHFCRQSDAAGLLVEDLQRVNRLEFSPPTLLGGRWIGRHRFADLSRMADLLQQRGFEQTAGGLAVMSEPYLAFQLTRYAADLAAQGRAEDASDFLERALEMFPRCVPALNGLGDLLRDRAETRKPDEQADRNLDLQNAMESFATALKIDPMSTEAIRGKAEVLIKQNNMSSAISELQAYLEVDPDRAEVQAILGRLYFAKGDMNAAATNLLAAWERRPTLPFVAGDLGFIYISSGEMKLGQKFLRLAHRLQPSDHNVVRHLAEAEFLNENYDDALPLLTRATQLFPGDRRSRQMLAWLLATSPFDENRDGKEGHKLMEPMIKIMENRSPATLEIYAACFAETGEFDKAIEFQRKAVAIVESGETSEKYSDAQKVGMQSRLALYRRKRPYRTADLLQIPISTTLKTR